jgi:hypothetical protein
MNDHLKFRRPAIAILAIALCIIGLTSVAGAVGTISVNVNDPGCVYAPQGDPYSVVYCSIQDAIDDSATGDTISVANGLYAEILSITHGLTLSGASEAGVVIDATGATGYHLTVDASDVTLQNFTLLGNPVSPASYGIKASGLNTSTRHTNFSISGVTVQNTYRTGLDINGLEGVSVNDVTVTGTIWGNGVALTDVDDAILSNITTSGNAWGGVAVYTYGRYYPLGSDNVSVTNLNAAEPNPFYVEIGNYSDPPSPAPVTNLSAPQFFYTVVNEPTKPLHTFYQETEALAVSFALAFPNPFDSYANRLADGNFIVSNDTTSYMGIQTAIDAASGGDTIEVRDGTYEESLYIDKGITLIGDSTSAVVAAPTAVPTCFTTSSAKHPVICIENTTGAVINTLTIDGLGHGNSNYQFVGVAFHNAGGMLQNSVITGIRDTPFSGAQHGVAIYSYNDDTVSRTISVWDNTVVDFQKNAMALNADSDTPMVIDVRGNTVTGAGATTVTAQNGIQAWGTQVTGFIDGNAISGIAYDNTNNTTKWVASSVLLYYTQDVDVTNNVIFGGHVGIYNLGSAGDLSNNNITIDKVGVYAFGIIATDPPEAVPSPYGDGGISGPMQAAGIEALTLGVDITGNFLLFHGPDNTATYAIEADPGYGPDDINLYVADNIIRGYDVGVELYECQSGCDTGVISVLNVTNNCIETNNIGLRSNLTLGVGASPITAENNWWGDDTGPAPTGSGDQVVGNVDYDPWLTTSICPLSGPGDWQNLTSGEYFATLQGAVDSASPDDTIMATGPGSYPGAVITTPNVNIDFNGAVVEGASPAITVGAANVTLSNGILVGPGTSPPNPGVLVAPGGNNLIMNNMEISGWDDGVLLDNASPFAVTSFKLVNSYIHDNDNAGLRIGANASLSGVITIEGNLFKANGTYGVQNLNGVDIDTTFNSWGCFAGPGASGCDAVSTNVLYDPWTFSEMFLDMDPPAELGVVNVLEGETFDVVMKVDAKNLTTIAFDFTYDSTMLTLNGPPTFAAPWAGSCAVAGAPPTGQVYYSCNLFFPSPGYTSMSSTIATFSFTAENNGGLVDPGPWSAYFDLNEVNTTSSTIGGVTVFVNNAGYGLPETRGLIDDADDGEVIIDPTGNFAGFIDLQGRSNDAGGVLMVYDNQVIASASVLATGTSVSSGSFTTIGSLLPLDTNYWLYADAPLYLPTTANGSVLFSHSADLDTRPLTSLNLLRLLGGDATDDNFINILDATCIGTDFGSSGSTCSTGSSDVNGDGIINILDLSLMGGNFSKTFSSWIPQ